MITLKQDEIQFIHDILAKHQNSLRLEINAIKTAIRLCPQTVTARRDGARKTLNEGIATCKIIIKLIPVIDTGGHPELALALAKHNKNTMIEIKSAVTQLFSIVNNDRAN